jgi:hypothetical protein
VLVYSTSEEPAPDTTAPTVTIAAPVKDQNVGLAPFDIGGSANDDVGVASVRLAIRDRDTLLWWTGTEWGAYTTLEASIAEPGAPTTTWSYSWTPPAAGNYGVLVRVEDTSANTNAVKPWVRFRAA